ncbi:MULTISPECIES: HAD family hydrolase [Catenuloplanes]|uniref:FMN phosphatase YigB (HAD superfamily) n=1 Tax=Catenuloplanes niger TaxID=587534 RepID=A0AAE4CUK7_9ACTN|nr:HAD family hydrolase [Catenuloplanes niger]MDR7325240.1 FMN phosphatase YigB (HAD superfamily) [Catenuloplanes niger]
MTEYGAVALDVGGVIYYDEPFELAWLQATYDLLHAADRAITRSVFIEQVERFYRDPAGDPAGRPLLHSPAGADAWARVRLAWTELAQQMPGAVRAATELARAVPVVIVANQPPECMRVLDAWGLTEACAAVFLDSLTGVAKPDPALLRLALDHLGVHPADLLVVGNRVDHDVVPARALGCPVAFVLADPGYRTPPGVHPDLERAYTSLRAVRTAPPADGDAWLRTVPALAALSRRPVAGPLPITRAEAS